MKIEIVPILGSLALLLMVGCASDFSSSSSSSDSSPAVDTSSIDEFNANQQRINDQMAVDAANAAAFQQNADAMAATQLFENQHNAEFNQNGLQ